MPRAAKAPPSGEAHGCGSDPGSSVVGLACCSPMKGGVSGLVPVTAATDDSREHGPHRPARSYSGAMREPAADLSGVPGIVRRRRAGWTVDTSASIFTRERRPLSCGAPSRAASSGGRPGHVASARPLVWRESLVSAGSSLRIIVRRAAGAAVARAPRLRSLRRSGGAARVSPRSPQTQLSRPRRISVPSRSR